MTELEMVKAAITKKDADIKASMDGMENIRRENIRLKLLAGKRALSCICDECLQLALNREEPNPRTCQRARAELQAERAKKAGLMKDGA